MNHEDDALGYPRYSVRKLFGLTFHCWQLPDHPGHWLKRTKPHKHRWTPWKQSGQRFDGRGPSADFYSRACLVCRDMEFMEAPARY